MKDINNSDFAYLIGNFIADGSFYSTERGYRFEFVDGSPYSNELKYSLEHINHIKKIIENFLDKKLPEVRKRGNRFVLSFRDKNLAKLFITSFKFKPGDKSRVVNIPNLYRNTIYEKDFWIGYLDGDGSIARKYKKVSVESMSYKIINSFSDYLDRNKIFFSKYKSIRGDDYSYVIVIRSVSFKDFCEKIGFRHPLKSRLLKNKLKDKDFFIKNNLNISENEIIDYTNIFDNSIFIVNGKKIFLKYGYQKYLGDNIRFNEIVSLLHRKGLSKEDILKEIINYRFKKSKGSTNSVKLPLFFNNKFIKIAKFVRIRQGGVSFSKRYIESFNEDFNNILKITEEMFDIKPKYTSKKEPLFCSGVISDFFNKVIKREN